MYFGELERLTKGVEVVMSEDEKKMAGKIIDVLQEGELTYDDAYAVLYHTALVLSNKSRFTHL